MNEKREELELIELGEVSVETKGNPTGPYREKSATGQCLNLKRPQFSDCP